MSEKKTNTTKVLDFGTMPHSSHSRLLVPVTLFKGINAVPERHIKLGELLAEMETTDIRRLNHSQTIVCAYEAYLQKIEAGENAKIAKKAYDTKKKTCSGFIMGTFSYREDKRQNCLEYVPCLVFDLDACVSTYDRFLYQDQLKKLDYVFAVFPSPSGYGLRVLVWTNATYETHRKVYEQVQNALSLHLAIAEAKGTHFDGTCHNESRLFFYVAVDPKAFYLNLESKIFETDPVQIEADFCHSVSPPKKRNDVNADVVKTIQATGEIADSDALMKRLDQNLSGHFAGRNDRLFHLAMRFKNNDIPLSDAEQYALQFAEPDFPMKEIVRTIQSAYQRANRQYSEAQKESFLGANTPKKAKKGEKAPPQASIQNAVPIANDGFAVQAESTSSSIFDSIEKKLRQKYDFRFNTLSRELEYRPKKTLSDFVVAEDQTLHNLLRFLAEHDMQVSQKILETSLYSDFVPQYHPIELYFSTLPAWDGQTDWIGVLSNYVVAHDQVWFERMFRKMLVRAIACLFGKSDNKHCFVLVGGQQTGKTSFLRYLCPAGLMKYFKENFKTDKDGFLALTQNWWILLDELDRLPKTVFEDLKAVFSMRWIKERVPYGRLPIQAPRIANFLGTANKRELLTDETGNIRWIIIPIWKVLLQTSEQKGYKSVEMDSVWAQAYQLYQSGFDYELTSEELGLLEAQNETFKQVYIEKELLNQYYKVPTPLMDQEEKVLHQTSANILIRLQKISSINTLKLSMVRKALSELGFKETQQLYKGRGYSVIEV